MKTFSSSPTSATPPAWFDQWKRAWPEALAVWSKFTRLSDPQLCASTVQAAREGLSGSFAMIRLLDQSVVVDLENVGKLGLEDYGVEVLAHEIGHHVLAPANVTDHYRLLARIRKGQPHRLNHNVHSLRRIPGQAAQIKHASDVHRQQRR